MGMRDGFPHELNLGWGQGVGLVDEGAEGALQRQGFGGEGMGGFDGVGVFLSRSSQRAHRGNRVPQKHDILTTPFWLPEFCSTRASIPKGLCPPAQGCEPRATLGNVVEPTANPNGVVALDWACGGHNPVGVGAKSRTVNPG
jgi:hypothetical protein